MFVWKDSLQKNTQFFFIIIIFNYKLCAQNNSLCSEMCWNSTMHIVHLSLSHGLDGFLTDVFAGLFSKSNNAPKKNEEEILYHSSNSLRDKSFLMFQIYWPNSLQKTKN